MGNNCTYAYRKCVPTKNRYALESLLPMIWYSTRGKENKWEKNINIINNANFVEKS